jgi:hypothetical protein
MKNMHGLLAVVIAGASPKSRRYARGGEAGVMQAHPHAQ